MPIESSSLTRSIAIGMRGRFTANIEISPRVVRSKDVAMIVPTVQNVVRNKKPSDLRRYAAIIPEKNKSGKSEYLPILTIISVIKESVALHRKSSKGKIKAAATPSAMPIKYFIQIFI